MIIIDLIFNCNFNRFNVVIYSRDIDSAILWFLMADMENGQKYILTFL